MRDDHLLPVRDGRVLIATPPDSLPGALVAARHDVSAAWDRAAKAGVGS